MHHALCSLSSGAPKAKPNERPLIIGSGAFWTRNRRMLFDHDGSLVTAYKLSDFEKEPSPKTWGYGGRFASKTHLHTTVHCKVR